ncbi:putative helicase mov-10-B.1 [Diretmus argenteus]
MRTSIEDKNELKYIYNNEFRDRTDGPRYPNFSRVLYALKVFQKVTYCYWTGTIRFCSQVRARYQDQWRSHRRQQPVPVQNGRSSPGPVEARGGAETGVRARRKLANHLMNKLKNDTSRAQFISDKHGISITSDLEFEDGRVSLCVEVHFHLSEVGFYPATLFFEFKAEGTTSTAFHIVRFIEVNCVTSLGMELAPIAPYKPRSIAAVTSEAPYTIVDGQPPESMSVMPLQVVVRLKKYKVPAYMNQLIKSLKNPDSFSDPRKALLEGPLSRENYSERFHLLLYLEELQMDVDIKKYNIPNKDTEHAPMFRDTNNKKLLVLEVPGVSENRPSVLRGDRLLVCPKGETGVKYEGYVHRVELDKVILGFSTNLLERFFDGMKFSVEFKLHDLTMRLQHRAVELMPQHGLGPVLFPAGATFNQQPEPQPLRLFDRLLENNPEQYQAIQHIVAGSSKPAPYLVFGPPGTGKTVTLVEAIKQIEKTQASCHILACAPSNSATDLLCKRILEHVNKRKVFRMYASSQDPKLVPEELLACSNLEGETYVYPEKQDLMKYKIMVTTLYTAGRLVTGNIPVDHFTHVFVDEAGHAVETECLIPLAESGQVVLAGDPKQLGPILRSPLVLKYGMGVSLLERLMKDFPLYQKHEGTYNNRYVTKLLRNYRSHPAILEIPNELFYEGELQYHADEMIRNSYCRWEHLPQKNFPVIFHPVMGLDVRESGSPSFFNVAEVEVLMDYLKKLLQSQGKRGLPRISTKDIGIIAPYRKQVQKIRKALEKVEKELKVDNMKDLKVGSVEEFQGQERRVIMVSTVRSSRKYTEIDQKFTLGFVKNEKRFNVAVTRAKALLIVVGNPIVLKEDDAWASFIKYCRDKGGCTDFDPTEEILMFNDTVDRLAALCISIDPQVETEESMVQQHLEPEWRSDL